MFTRRRGRSSGNQDAQDNTPKTPVNWRRLFSYLGPYKWRMALAILALAFGNAMGLAFPLVIVRLLD